MASINKLLKKKHKLLKKNILLTLMFTNYGMDGPNQVNTQINTENSLKVSPLQQEINSMKEKAFDDFVRIITFRINKIEELFISIMKNYYYSSSFKKKVYSMQTDYNNIRDFIIKEAKNNYNVNYDSKILYEVLKNNTIPFLYNQDISKIDKKNTINQTNFNIPETFIEKIIKIFIELSEDYKDKYNTNTFPQEFENLSINIKNYIETMEEYFVFISLDLNDLCDKNLLENVLDLYDNVDIIFHSYFTKKEKSLLETIKKLIELKVKIFNCLKNKEKNKKPLYIEALNKLKQNGKFADFNKFIKYIKLQEKKFPVDPQEIKKQEFDNFFQKITIIVNDIEEILNTITNEILQNLNSTLHSMNDSNYHITTNIEAKKCLMDDCEIIKNTESENSFLYKNILSFIEQAKKNYNPDYKLDILYQESTVIKNNIHEIFTPFLYDIDKYKDKEKPINFISNMIKNIKNFDKFLKNYHNYYLCDLPRNSNKLYIQINEYISTMEKYLFFITMEKYIFFKSKDLRENFLFNLQSLYENPNIEIKNGFYLTEEKFVLEQFKQLIILREEIQKKNIINPIEPTLIMHSEINTKSLIPEIIEDYCNNKPTRRPWIQKLYMIQKLYIKEEYIKEKYIKEEYIKEEYIKERKRYNR